MDLLCLLLRRVICRRMLRRLGMGSLARQGPKERRSWIARRSDGGWKVHLGSSMCSPVAQEWQKTWNFFQSVTSLYSVELRQWSSSIVSIPSEKSELHHEDHLRSSNFNDIKRDVHRPSRKVIDCQYGHVSDEDSPEPRFPLLRRSAVLYSKPCSYRLAYELLKARIEVEDLSMEDVREDDRIDVYEIRLWWEVRHDSSERYGCQQHAYDL